MGDLARFLGITPAQVSAIEIGLDGVSWRDAILELAQGLGALFVCAEHGAYCRVRTPYLYPDGDNIDLFCKSHGDVVTVSDLGETTRWLRMQTLSPRRSPKQRSLLEDACLTHGVEFYKGMLQARCRPQDGFAAVVIRLAQAALRVSDGWSVDFHVRAPKQNHPDGTACPYHAKRAREACQEAAQRGECTWALILAEEFFEAMAESNPLCLREELIQVAAVAVQWIEAIDRRGAGL